MLRLGLMFLAAGAVCCVGCRSIGRFPGINPTDYAYSYFNGTSSQVYAYTVPQVESSALEALTDLGFKKIDRVRDGDVVKITAKTLDHRHAWVKIQPRNTMTSLSVRIGAEGDAEVSEALIQRISLNFGALPRTIIPLEPTLARRHDPIRPPQTQLEPLTPPVPVFEDFLAPAPSSASSPFAPTDAPGLNR